MDLDDVDHHLMQSHSRRPVDTLAQLDGVMGRGRWCWKGSENDSESDRERGREKPPSAFHT